MVAFDNTILSLLMFPDADLRQGRDGQKVEYARERFSVLFKTSKTLGSKWPCKTYSLRSAVRRSSASRVLTNARRWNWRCVCARPGRAGVRVRAFRSQRTS